MKTIGKIILAAACVFCAYATVKLVLEIFGSSMKKYYVAKEI